jgi:hypothetical protein
MSIRVILVFFGLLTAFTAFYIQNELDAQNIILKFERTHSMGCYLCDLDILVNRVKAGEIGNDETKMFRIPRSATNNYNIETKLISMIGPNIDGMPKSINASPGSKLYAQFETNAWVSDMSRYIKLDVVLEPEMSHSWKLLPSLINKQGAHLVSGLNGKQMNFPWDAIGAIAGIAGLFR